MIQKENRNFMPVCSIVIPVFNREETVEEAAESCLSQDYPFIQLILVDDGSSDSSVEICERLVESRQSEGKTVVLIQQKNAGACVARNKGMAHATGEFLMFLDSDDLITREKISAQIHAIEQTGADCCISDYMTIDDCGQPLTIYRNNIAPIDFITRLKSPSNSAILMRRSTLPVGLLWNTSLVRMQDFDFMLRYLSGVETWVYIPESFYHYRLHERPRISDSYRYGMPYGEMFRSMYSYLSVYPPKKSNRFSLLARYGVALLRANLRDVISRNIPRWLKRQLKYLLTAKNF